ncbi:hypothetical protein AB9F35_36860, partial [Rhizobium leguminosarum]
INCLVAHHQRRADFGIAVLAGVEIDEAVYGTAQLPKFAEDLFRTTDGRWLIPTAAVTLPHLVCEALLAQAKLPLRFT